MAFINQPRGGMREDAARQKAFTAIPTTIRGFAASCSNHLSRHGNGRYRAQVFDHFRDAETRSAVQVAGPAAVLLLDGIFLHRPELHRYWDLSVWLEVDVVVSVPRGAARGEGYGSADATVESNRRYVEGQRLYRDEAQPERLATIVIDNNDLAEPIIIR
jgi:uridine kinase